MSYIKKPSAKHPLLPKNRLGLTRRDYEGALSTLCAGCGHDSVSSAIIEACFNLSIPAHKLAKLSGIGCSSKTPTYFLNKSHGFNSVHGRMPSVATGANLANRDLFYLGVNENLHYFKRCAITAMEVNYQGEGQNLLFADSGAPVRVDLSLTFQETEIWTAEDYEYGDQIERGV